MEPAGNTLVADTRRLLDQWVSATVQRDADAYADLFLRDPDPLVAWPSGEITRGWKALHEHCVREFYHAKSMVHRVDIFDLEVVPVTDDTADAVFHYDVHATDLWGTALRVRRLGTVTLARTKDGLKIASLHLGPAAPPPAGK